MRPLGIGARLLRLLCLIAHMLWRILVLVHRYLGVAVGLVMLMWFASGVVMLYVQYPTLAEKTRLAALAPIPWNACCDTLASQIDSDQPVDRAQVESIAGTLALRLKSPGRPELLASLDSAVDEIPLVGSRAWAIAAATAQRLGLNPSQPSTSEVIQRDQWTVGEQYNGDRPLIRFEFNDAARTRLYVSSTSGRVLLWTTARQRFWNWLGAVPHWLYPTILRSHPRVWAQVVVWLAVIGVFLTIFGLYLGVVQFGLRGKRKLSPYPGVWNWHHSVGLVFGIFAFTWVLSGLISMNPWGLLDSEPGQRFRPEGTSVTWAEVRASLAGVRNSGRVSDMVSLLTAPLAGRLFWIATLKGGAQVRLDGEGHPASLSQRDLLETGRRMAGAAGVASATLLRQEDSYYYRRHEPIVLPVFRIIANDRGHTRFYLDAFSGQLLERIDAAGRWQRWLFDGLHRWDFSARLRASVAWNLLILVPLLGGIALSATGAYLAVRRVVRELAGLWRKLGRRRSAKLAGLPCASVK